jgi:HAMP domain-containing protein
VRYKWREGWKIAALAKINLAELGPEFEWRLGVGINESDIFAPIQHLLAWFIMIPSAVAFSMVLLNFFIGRKVSVSLNEFAQLARDAARGRFSQLARARTDDELGNLAQAFNEMLVSFRAQIPFTRIPNHYVVGNPIRTAEMFFGRQEDLQWLGKQLEHAGNKMVLLFGPRRIGKTSLLHQICAGRASPNVLPFFFDTQQIIPELIENADFYHVLTREMLSQLPVILPELKTPFISTERFSPDTLRRLLRFIHDSEPHKVPVLLFDELENLEFKFNRGSLTADVLLFLAGLLDGNVPVSFVATGSDQLERLKFPDWHILTPKTIPRHIGLLTRNDARRLILEPIRGYLLYDDGVPERILRITAGHPYYTQVVCQSLVDYLNQKQEFALSLAQLSEVMELVLDNPPPPLNHVWESFSDVEKTAAAGLAHVLAGEEQYVGTERVLASMPLELSAEARDPVKFRSALDHLSREDWVEKNDNGAYRFQLDLLRLWIGREHSIWQVADELQRSPK